MIRLVKATAECPSCGERFHQIDGTEERALEVVRSALAKHEQDEHRREADTMRKRTAARLALLREQVRRDEHLLAAELEEGPRGPVRRSSASTAEQ